MRSQFTLPNDEFVLNASKGPALSQRVLQIRGFARYCLFTGSNCTRTCHSQTQGRHYVRQAKRRLIEPSECQRRAQRFSEASEKSVAISIDRGFRAAVISDMQN